jgi:hypothetical protein
MEGKYLFLPFSRNHSGCERSFHFSLLNTRDIGSNPPRLILAEQLPADRRPGFPRNALLGASLIKLRKYGHKFLGFTGFRIDFL